MDPVVLLTDFGLEDHYVGVMKGVIAGISPASPVIDLVHSIPPHDIRAAAFALAASYRYFPPRSIFCCVVDPGVGSARRAVAVALEEDWRAVLPDNGILTLLLQRKAISRAVVVERLEFGLGEMSATFHGRDLFAPVAAHLSAGVDLAELGTDVPPSSLVRLPWPEPAETERGWRAHVLHIDRFGNLVTDLAEQALGGRRDWRLRLGGRDLPGVRRTFAEVGRGEPVAYVGSSGFLEIAVREGSAARAFGCSPGDPVELERP